MCSRPATRPCTFVINPSLFLTLKIFLLLKWQFFSFFYEKLLVIYLSIYLSVYIYIKKENNGGSQTLEQFFFALTYEKIFEQSLCRNQDSVSIRNRLVFNLFHQHIVFFSSCFIYFSTLIYLSINQFNHECFFLNLDRVGAWVVPKAN